MLIGGFIINGTDPKMVILRAIGPSLADFGVAGALADPVLELRAADGSVIASNDNWISDRAAIEATGLQPSKDLESAIIATIDPGAYTAIVNGKNGTTGIGLVEAYDLNAAAASELANISTRGFVQTQSNVMIGGFILGSEANVLIRAIGPTLSGFGVADALADPTLELHDAQGTLLSSNDNWKEPNQLEIELTGLQPQMGRGVGLARNPPRRRLHRDRRWPGCNYRSRSGRSLPIALTRHASRERRHSTVTPFQKATRSLMFAAASFGVG